MAITSYNTLRDAIAGNAGQSFSHRGDVLSNFDTFLALAEEHFWDRLRIRDMDTRTTSSASTSSRFLALPTGFLQYRKLTLSGSVQYPLVYKTPESLQIQASAGLPRSFTVTSQIEFDRIPDSAYTVEHQYWAKLTALSSSNQTNAIITNYPSIYLYGCMYFLQVWAMNDVKMGTFLTLFEKAIDRVNSKEQKARYGPAAAAIREGSKP